MDFTNLIHFFPGHKKTARFTGQFYLLFHSQPFCRGPVKPPVIGNHDSGNGVVVQEKHRVAGGQKQPRDKKAENHKAVFRNPEQINRREIAQHHGRVENGKF